MFFFKFLNKTYLSNFLNNTYFSNVVSANAIFVKSKIFSYPPALY
jgi:hypothetical protein